MNEDRVFTLDDWMFELPPEDYDLENTELIAQLDAALGPIAQLCKDNDIPFSFIMATGARNGGIDTRRSSTGHMFALNRVSPEVLMCNLIAQHGAEFFAQNWPEISQKIYGKALFLNKLRQTKSN